MTSFLSEISNLRSEIHPAWPTAELADICQIFSGTTPAAGNADFWKPDHVWVTPTDLGKLDQSVISDSARRVSELAVKLHNLKLCPPRSVILSSRAPIGHVAIAGAPVCCNQGCKILVPRNGLDSYYLYFAMKRVVPDLQRLGSGATFAEVSKAQLESFEIPVPPLPEQRRIATLLTQQLAAVDQARRAATEKLAAAEELSRALLRSIFDGPESNDWRTSTLREVCQADGQYGTSIKSNAQNRGLPVLGMYHIHEGKLRWEKLTYADLPHSESHKYRLQKGDLLFNRTNSAELVGKTAVFDGARDAVFASYLIRFRIDATKADPRFISAFINSRQGRAFIERNMGRAAGQVNISASTMHQMPIPCPPANRQRELMDQVYLPRLRIAEHLRADCLGETATIDALPSALLRRAFEGTN